MRTRTHTKTANREKKRKKAKQIAQEISLNVSAATSAHLTSICVCKLNGCASVSSFAFHWGIEREKSDSHTRFVRARRRRRILHVCNCALKRITFVRIVPSHIFGHSFALLVCSMPFLFDIIGYTFLRQFNIRL